MASPAANNAPGFAASMTVPAIAGVLVTPQSALTFTAYFAAVQVLSTDLASLPLAVFRRRKSGGNDLIDDHQINERFNITFDHECPAFNSRESAQSQILGWGNYCAEIDWSSGGDVLGMQSINPSLILPKRDEKNGRLYYEILNGGKKTKLPPWKVFHVAALGFNGLWGYSPVALGREGIGQGKASEQFMSGFFGNAINPGGTLEYPGSLKPEAIKNLRESINLVHQGSAAAFKMMILEQGMRWNPSPMSPQTAQVLDTRKFNVLEICRLLRVPPHKLQDYSHVQPTNLEIINDDYATSCIRPWCVRWEGAISFKLLTETERKQGLYVRFNMAELLRANTKDRADWYQKMSMIGIYSPDEIRCLENLNPIGEKNGGSKRFRQASLIELSADQPIPNPSQVPGPDKPQNEEKSRIGAYLNGQNHGN